MAEAEFSDADIMALFNDNVTARSEEEDLLASLIGDALPVGARANAEETVESAVYGIEAAPPASALPGLPLLNAETAPSAPARAPVSVATANSQGRTGYSWENARHLLPEAALPLIDRYPAIGLCQHAEFGLVVMAAYLEDTVRRIRRNLKLGDDMFFHAPELHSFAPDLRAFNCRVVVKTIRHQPGMVIRFWENTPDGDLPDRGAYVVRARGFERVGARR